ncbi:MAG: metalloregulator ArsR/SmtB family transcription factor [Meiothermus sp.]|uniref:ArsR/SmtB family transcription factor n=1 Tax=Meiothermus sp. TaxID=1955249 RepID=UPI0025E7A74A|nr:metalloregulator ArsR/SmtB family transcription factor [Meiothermus sp.]MCS7059461.1 metalloregulator ArsR/SmtB family transcription factor [Meiothermus sp.]MCS7193875.1 metalloregulator ArsR/SmtB family transcription factor [Meiothermus sp.]MCX7739499.1 metalloregulator ArsR/SmtB family transcription factor [Meiothermus sp.]MDW8090178.1 metalloregulator ArsR/SmtB family transcription factor [Meiothermus sp.]MDW8481480.1 metalloregulator ArsR/SmtB family transcription factor [Meiothermus sp
MSVSKPKDLQAVSKALPRLPQVQRASELLKAIADPTRMRILSALQLGELCVSEISKVVGMSESAVSHQLRVLRNTRLVAGRREGRSVHYRLADAHVRAILQAALEHASE